MPEGAPIIIKKKKVHGGHAHHGGSWKVAYADFVTAMMAFFLVMWIMGLSADKRNIIAAYFKDPIGFAKNEPKYNVNISPKGTPVTAPNNQKQKDVDPSKKDEQKIRLIKKQIEQAIAQDAKLKAVSKDVEITITSEGLRIELVETTGAVFFETGSAVVRPAALELMSKISPILASSKRAVMVEGHTDSAPYPSETYNNWDLSSDRANAMRRVLTGDGVGKSQIQGIRAYADTRLKDRQNPASFVNRRTSLLLPFDTNADLEAELPRAELENQIHGAFHKDVDVSPSR